MYVNSVVLFMFFVCYCDLFILFDCIFDCVHCVVGCACLCCLVVCFGVGVWLPYGFVLFEWCLLFDFWISVRFAFVVLCV